MKIFSLSFLFIFFFNCLSSKADEGMWLPFLLEQLNQKKMQELGMKISAKDIYDVNNTSMKDAVVLFGGGCTAEVISNSGLVLTNHHCGYSYVQALSSVKDNYFDKGYWAMNKLQELPCKGLSVTFIVEIVDVTAQVLNGIQDTMPEGKRELIIKSNASKIEKSSILNNANFGAQIKSFYNGNQYYLFLTETFKDIRLVGFPPNSIGNFGGDTDNWVWPRHNADFSLFRIYANKDNHAANYSEDNLPFRPKYFFPISTKGIKEGDFTMVYGFPGRTQEYLTADGVDLVMNYQDPTKIKIREKRLNVWQSKMSVDTSVFIKYTSKQKGLSNAYKKWQGELLGLHKNNAIALKRSKEVKFQNWANNKPLYTSVLSNISQHYVQLKKVSNAIDFINEAAFGVELIQFAGQFNALIDSSFSTTLSDSLFKNQVIKLQNAPVGFFKNYDLVLDKQMAKELFKLYFIEMTNSNSLVYCPIEIQNNRDQYIDKLYKKSIFLNMEKLNGILMNAKRSDIRKLKNDMAFILYSKFKTILDKELNPIYNAAMAGIAKNSRLYTKGILEMNEEKNNYPDANSTLRVAYGKFASSLPKDGIKYQFFTTLDGVMEKENAKNEEFVVPVKLKELYKTKNYGKYEVNGTVPLAFIATNHTTGGNSGSPVLNANGELIGTNFDRMWEGTMSDILFDNNLCRNISVDIRYTLFIIDKFANAGYLLNEMKIID
jgi:hypothetical protein